MRGGLVAAGILCLILGFSWWLLLGPLASLFPGLSVGILATVWLICIVPVLLIIIGFMLFIAGLVGKSQAEIEAMRQYPAQGPQVIIVDRGQPASTASGPSPSPPSYPCPVCKTTLSWAAQYRRWYCSTCREYR